MIRDQSAEKRRGSRRSSGDKCRIYSPFVSENPEQNEYNKNSFDRFGDFGYCVANTANSFIWEPEEGNANDLRHKGDVW